MSKCEYETTDGRCILNECMYGDFLFTDDSAFESGRYCLCDDVKNSPLQNHPSYNKTE